MAGATQVLGTGARFIRLLTCVAEAAPEFTLKEIAARLDLPPSTTHRLLQQLVAGDLVERTPQQGYRVGRELFRVASLVTTRFDLSRLARPFLRALREAWGETCVLCLYVPANRSGVAAEVLATSHPLRHVIEPLSPIALTWGSLGQAILAWLPPEEAGPILRDAQPGPISGRPPPDPGRIVEELEEIRRRGCAVYQARPAPDLAGVAAPVFGSDGGVLGSLGVTVPGPRFALLSSEALCDDVVRRAAELSQVLGFRPT